MIILQVVDNICIDSGVSSVIMNIYRNIDKTKVKFDFLVSSEELSRGKNYEDEIKLLGGEVTYFKSPLSIETMLESAENLNNFFRDKSYKYDIVHLHTPTIGMFVFYFARKHNIKRRIIHSHSTMTSNNKIKSFINCFLNYNSVKLATEYWACSTEAGEFLYKKKVKFNIINNPIDVSKYYFDLDERNLLRFKLNITDKIVFLHISNYTKIKNTKFLIEVVKRIKDRRKVFIFLGDGPEKNSLKKAISNYKLTDRCILISRTDNVKQFLCASDCLLLPSIKEGLPVSVIEAQATGMHCFVSDTITKECNAGGVDYIKLQTKEWVRKINEFEKLDNYSRELRENKFKRSRFNICNSIKNIYSAYGIDDG